MLYGYRDSLGLYFLRVMVEVHREEHTVWEQSPRRATAEIYHQLIPSVIPVIGCQVPRMAEDFIHGPIHPRPYTILDPSRT